MNNKALTDLNPKPLWENFTKICTIPRPSHHEEKISAFMEDFGKKLNLPTIKDKYNNVIIKKPATPGMENCKTVILQAHLDMVPQKNSNIQHDFTKDPIQAYIDGEYVTAKGTTLGADNGMGVAAIMSILQASDIQHSPIEALFTSSEEDGMVGANNLNPKHLSGTILLNLDTEIEGEIDIGCAGGVITEITLPYATTKVASNATAWQIKITNLRGGHSGTDIHLQRGNANKILNRLLWQITNDCAMQLGSFAGGSVANAIPREAAATVIIPNKFTDNFKQLLEKFNNTIKQELGEIDPDVKITTAQTDLPKSVFNSTDQKKLLQAVYGCQNGVMRMSHTMKDLVETSTNLGMIKTESDCTRITTLQRSSSESCKLNIATMIAAIFSLAGGKIEHSNAYPGWQPNPKSQILQVAKKAYQEKFGNDPEIRAIHAGLECALFGDILPNLDMISIGPTIKFPHSPDEKVYIPSVAKFWDFLLTILKEIPK